MKKLLLTLFIGLFFIQVNAQEKAKKAVRNCFTNYKEAILNDKGQEAVEHLSVKTINYYNNILDLSLHADSNKMEELRLMDKFMVLALRHRTPIDKLRSFDGRKTLIFAIEKGMIGKNSVARNEIGEVSIDKNKAEAQAIINNQPTPIQFVFYKENDDWKLDLTSIFSISSKGFEQLIKSQDKSENEYLLYLLELTTSIKVSNDIWKPIGDK
jgi:hypothetical protein